MTSLTIASMSQSISSSLDDSTVPYSNIISEISKIENDVNSFL